MRKDWVVWVGCVSLFGAGVVWGAIPKGFSFFHIKDIHDLAETFAGFATVIGVVLAVTEYRSWKSRKLAESDHELSKKALTVIHAYKPLAVDIYVMSELLCSKMYSQIGYRDPPIDTLESVKNNLKLFKDAHAEIYAVALECRDSWEAEKWDRFDEIFSLTDRCKAVVELFLLWSNDKLDDNVRFSIAEKAISAFDVVRIFIGNDKEAVEAHLTKRFEVLANEVKSKRLTV